MKYFKKNAEKINGYIVVLPNFGDELGGVNTIKMTGLNVPLLVQAIDDVNNKVDVKSCRDAFCGKLSMCNNLHHFSIKFINTTYYTYDLYDEEFTKDIYKFTAVCRVVKGMKGLRVGAIETSIINFQTMRFSEKILQKS